MSEVTDEMRRRSREMLARWRVDPVAFFLEALGLIVWSGQAQMAEAIRDHDQVAVRSGQKSGKSTVLAAIALWWFMTRKRAAVYITAPSEALIIDAIWPELTKLITEWEQRGAKGPVLPRDWLNLDPGTGLRAPDGRFVKARTTSVHAPARIAGRSGDELLFLIDEASEYENELWSPIFGNMAGGGKLLATGNPTQTSGVFFDSHHSNRAHWKTLHIRTTDNPNYVARKKIIPGLALYDWCEAKRLEWGEKSADYQVRVLGEFPTQGSDSVIALENVEAAQKRWTKEPEDAASKTLVVGVDVARFGTDNSSIAVRRGRRARIAARVNGFDSTELSGLVISTVKAARMPAEAVTINVDDSGGWGSGVVDRLREWAEQPTGKGGPGFRVTVSGINVSTNADDEDEYHSRRDQLWFGCAEWLLDGALEPDERLAADLLAPKYSFDGRGRRKVEPKENMKKRIGRSPDDGDALCLAVYSGRGKIETVDMSDIEDLSRWNGYEGRGFG